MFLAWTVNYVLLLYLWSPVSISGSGHLQVFLHQFLLNPQVFTTLLCKSGVAVISNQFLTTHCALAAVILPVVDLLQSLVAAICSLCGCVQLHLQLHVVL